LICGASCTANKFRKNIPNVSVIFFMHTIRDTGTDPNFGGGGLVRANCSVKIALLAPS